jgi:hypothetical protein
MPEGQKGIGVEVGGPVTQNFNYDDLYRLTQANGEYRHEKDQLQRYRLAMAYDSIHSGRVAAQQRGTHRRTPCGCNIQSKEQLHEKVEIDHGKTHTDVEHDTSHTYGCHYAAPQTGSQVGTVGSMSLIIPFLGFDAFPDIPPVFQVGVLLLSNTA